MQLTSTHTQPVAAGTIVVFYARLDDGQIAPPGTCTWTMFGPRAEEERVFESDIDGTFNWDTSGLRAGAYDIRCDYKGDGWATQTIFVIAGPAGAASPEGVVPVSLQRTSLSPTDDQILWVVIRNRTNAIGFRSYRSFIDGVMCGDNPKVPTSPALRSLPYRGADAYNLVKFATDIFLMHETGVLDLDDDVSLQGGLAELNATKALTGFTPDDSEARRLGRRTVAVNDLESMRKRYYVDLEADTSAYLPYLRIIRERLKDIPLKTGQEIPPTCYGILKSHLTGPLAIELIWSYWMEEGMLAQALNAILARFQNRRLVAGVDPLARFDLDPLRPLSNLFWGWVQDEIHRLTVRRRAFEYAHEYGLSLIGKAVPRTKTVDRRSKFIESFHNLLYVGHVFFAQDDDTTVIADGFPLLNALRETHLLLAEGAHNQFGDLPSAARAEMMIMQWLLARPEMRDFLGGRTMVPYEEDWMDRVDMMKSVQGWTDVTITHFRDMAVYGEQILLTVRYGDWSTANDPQQAANWARYWRPEIQRYVHAYRAASGVDLTERVDGTLPSELLRRRLATQRRAQ